MALNTASFDTASFTSSMRRSVGAWGHVLCRVWVHCLNIGLSLLQLKEDFPGPLAEVDFPGKKWLALTEVQVAERRAGLEKFLQACSQDLRIASSERFSQFMVQAQRVSFLSSSHRKALFLML